MTAEKYVNSIVKRIRCNADRKKEIKKQLLSDIGVLLEQGIPLAKVMDQMGDAKDIAEGFHETIPEEEQKRYLRNKNLKTAGIIMAIVIVILVAVWWLAPKVSDIEDSSFFNQVNVEAQMREDIELVYAGEFESLREKAAEQMQSVLISDTMNAAKKQVAEDWGEVKSYEDALIVEVTQSGRHFAVGEIKVNYENVSVIYRITYDQDMKLSGLYMR